MNVYITINGIRFTEEHGGIRSDKSTLIVTIPDIGMDYDAAVFVCYAGGEESNSITIHGKYTLVACSNYIVKEIRVLYHTMAVKLVHIQCI